MTRRCVLWFALGLLGCVAALGAWAAYFVYAPLRFAGEIRDFDIERGMTLRSVSRKLNAAGVLSDAWRFELLARLLKRGGMLKAGSFQIDAEWSALQLLDAITGTAYRLDKVALLEGWTFRQVRIALNDHVSVRHDTLGFSDAQILELLKMTHEQPEGLFFPDTYYFARGTSDTSLLRRAAQRMQQQLDRQWAERAEGLPLRSAYDALILASIVEKETGREADRSTVAAVFVNRLRKGMRLQADPTVIYGLGDAFDGNLRRRDLETDGPYNTYTRVGLPPTPIAIPGLASLSAAVRPASSAALYFVARGDGSSYFSETLAEHNRAVTKYQRQATSEK
jgi:UPF0755 protein